MILLLSRPQKPWIATTAMTLWLCLFSISTIAALRSSVRGLSAADDYSSRATSFTSTLFMDYYTTTDQASSKSTDETLLRKSVSSTGTTSLLTSEQQAAMEEVFRDTYNRLVAATTVVVAKQATTTTGNGNHDGNTKNGTKVTKATITQAISHSGLSESRTEDPLDGTQLQHRHQLQWSIQASCETELGCTRRLFDSHASPSPSEFQQAYQEQLRNHPRHRHLFAGASQLQLHRLTQVEAAAFDCPSDASSFTSRFYVTVESTTNDLDLETYRTLWVNLIRSTYNSLSFYACDAPHFRTLVNVQVREPKSYDAAFRAAISDWRSSSIDRHDFGGRRLLQEEQQEPVLYSKTLEVTVVAECRWECQGIGSLFVINADSTSGTEEEEQAMEAELQLPSTWQPPSLADLQGTTSTSRQAIDEQADTCYCAAEHVDDTSLQLTPELFQLGLQTTLQSLQLQQDGALANVTDINSLVEVQDQDCQAEPTMFETRLLLELVPPDDEFGEHLETFNESESLLRRPLELGQKVQDAYNSLAFAFCDSAFHRIRNVTVDMVDMYVRQVALIVRVECQGCDAFYTGNASSIFYFTSGSGSNNETLVDNSTVLAPAPEEACLCPVVTSQDDVPRTYRPPTTEEVMVVLQEQMEEQVNFLYQVEAFDCTPPPMPEPPMRTITVTLSDVPDTNADTVESTSNSNATASNVTTSNVTDSSLIYTTVVVDFEGHPELIDDEEAKVLEDAFQSSYNTLSFLRCDAKFRTVGSVQLFVVPKNRYASQEELHNVTGRGAPRLGRELQQDQFQGGRDTANANNDTLGFDDGLGTTRSTTVFRVGVDCRRCEDTESDTFGLFDSFDRRNRELQSTDPKDLILPWTSNLRPSSPEPEAVEEVGETCFCPFGRDPDDDLDLTEGAFEEIFATRVEQLHNESVLRSVEAVVEVKADEEFCSNALEEYDIEYILDFEGLDVSRYTASDFETALEMACKDLRTSECDPYLIRINSVDILSLGGDGVRRLQDGVTRVVYDITVAEAQLTFPEFMASRTGDMEFLVVQQLSSQARAGEDIAVREANGPTDPPTEPPTEPPTDPPTEPPTEPPTPEPTRDPTPNPTPEPTPNPTPSPTPDPTNEPTPNPTPDPTPQPTPSPTADPTSSPSASPSSGPSSSPSLSSSPSSMPSSSPSALPSVSPSVAPSGLPSAAPSGSISPSLSPSGSSSPSEMPSSIPSESASPSTQPTDTPSESPSSLPSVAPSSSVFPSIAPSATPSASPSLMPSASPSGSPSMSPSVSPSSIPSSSPSASPSSTPSVSPSLSISPSDSPSEIPSVSPSASPTTLASFCGFVSLDRFIYMGFDSTLALTDAEIAAGFISAYAAMDKVKCSAQLVDATVNRRVARRRLQTAATQVEISLTLNQAASLPFLFTDAEKSTFMSAFAQVTGVSATVYVRDVITTRSPTASPTRFPTEAPTKAPTKAPTESPTKAPTESPTPNPTNMPTPDPTNSPTPNPTNSPTPNPTNTPTPLPTNTPTPLPTPLPTNTPTPLPTPVPTEPPTPSPTDSPTKAPTDAPTTASPTKTPTEAPTDAPTKAPTETPTDAPTKAPTKAPTESPTKAPTKAPTEAPTKAPTKAPTEAPTKAPTESPTKAPTETPTEAPTKAPTKAPTEAPTKAPTEAPTPTPATITSWVLVDSDTNADIKTVNDGDTIDLGSFTARNLNLRAETNPSTVSEVVFYVAGSGTPSHQETAYPYALGGHSSGNYAATSILKTLTKGSALNIKADPYTGGTMAGSGTKGVTGEINILIVNTGKVVVGDSSPILKDYNLQLLVLGNYADCYYYGSGSGCTGIRANTADGLEDDNSDEVLLAGVKNSDGMFVMVIYDKPFDGSGGNIDAAITGDDLSGKLEFFDNPGLGDASGYPNLKNVWLSDNTDGYAIGPYSDATEVCFQFNNASNMSNGAQYKDATKQIQLLNSASELTTAENKICITLPEP